MASPCGSAPSAPPSRATGKKAAPNRGAAGNCTFGALEQWKAATGYYPLTSGDAKDWPASVRANGWTVVADAQDRSMAVFQPGVHGAKDAGHVAWVTGVQQRPDGLYVTVIEMNGVQGLGKYNTRTVKDVYGMSYILAP